MLSVFRSCAVLINTKLVGLSEMEKLEELYEYIVDYIFVHMFILMCMCICEFMYLCSSTLSTVIH